MKIHLMVSLSFFVAMAFGQPTPHTQNVFIVTIDGIRWQEIFQGADPAILHNPRYTADLDLAGLMYYDSSLVQCRRKLLPFLWTVVGQRGQLYGNRLLRNKMNVANVYKFSYPGYNEIFTGYPDLYVNSNHPVENLNSNVLAYLNSLEPFKNKVAAFASWNIFDYILNKRGGSMPVNSGYDTLRDDSDGDAHFFNEAQDKLVPKKTGTRDDALTFMAATEYIKANKPKVVLIGWGQCDEDAHQGRYDTYLQHLRDDDQMIQQLWYYIQSTAQYKDKTTLIITTDHGRGKKNNTWINHDSLVSGSGETWLAVIGPDTSPLGEIRVPQQLYQKQIAATIAALLGYHFTGNHPVAKSIDFKN